MRSEQYKIDYGSLSISYTVVRRERKTLEIGVEPDSSVTIVAPFAASQETIAAKVQKRASWIIEQQNYFEQFSPRMPEKRYMSGETHLYLGRQYRLKVIEAKQDSVKLLCGHIVIQIRHPENCEEIRVLLNQWYRTKAREKFLERIEACAQRFSKPSSVMPTGITIRGMQKRWGSMSHTYRLLLNQRLIQAPTYLIDYVITHELCHIIEPYHNTRYFRILERAMHDWEKRKNRLEIILS